MKVGLAEILAILCVVFFIFAGIGTFLFGMWFDSSMYTKEYVQAEGARLTEQWIWSGLGVIMGGVVVSFIVWFLGKYLAEYATEKNLAKDEREKMIHNRSYMMAYGLFILALLALYAYEMLMGGTDRDLLYKLMMLAVFLNIFSLALNKYVLR
jgi:formate/nitrite transporter FocA (FNT family)